MLKKLGTIIVGGIVGALIGSAITFLSCGTYGYFTVDPHNELGLHPFFVPAILGTMYAGAPVGLIVGVIAGFLKLMMKPPTQV